MGCNLTANCDGTGDGACYSACCGVTCPPDGLCSYVQINYKAGSNTPQYPCECSSPFWKKIFGIKTVSKKQKNNRIKESDLKYNLSLAGQSLPPIPSFSTQQNNDTNFIFAQGCSVPCNAITVTITTSNSCGISLGGSVGGSECCCSHGEGKVYASIGGGGECKASLSWTEQSVSNGGSVGFPSVKLDNSCCGLKECSRICGGTALWKSTTRGDKLRLKLNKKEFINRINKIRKFRIQSRKKRNIRGS